MEQLFLDPIFGPRFDLFMKKGDRPFTRSQYLDLDLAAAERRAATVRTWGYEVELRKSGKPTRRAGALRPRAWAT